MDLHSISSNLLLIGFLLISLCCLYLLYSNFIKVREIDAGLEERMLMLLGIGDLTFL